MLEAGIEPTLQVLQESKTIPAVDGAATGIGTNFCILLIPSDRPRAVTVHPYK